MNTDTIKKNLGTIIFVLAVVGGLGYSGWRLRLALAAQDAVVQELEAERAELSQLERFRPFPSNDNVQALLDNRSLMEKLHGELQTAAARPIEVPEIDQVRFATILAQRLSELTRQARRAKINLPNQFAFGFQEYIGVLPPDNQEVIDTITKQLEVITRISQLLYETETTTITGITREPVYVPQLLPPGTEAATDQTPSLYQKMRFGLQFTTTTPGLQKFLNDLTKEPWLLVVARLELTVNAVSFQVPLAGAAPGTTTGSQLPGSPYPSRPPTPGYWQSGAPPPPMMDPTSGMMIPPDAYSMGPDGYPAVPTPTYRTVERDDLQVNIQIDLIEFPPTSPADQEQPES